ncbi:unnamed protein product, partial [Aureobasidium pullulans]
MRSSIYQFLVGCFAAIGSFLFGYDLFMLTSVEGVIAEVVASDSFKASFLQENADSRSGTVVALFTAGCFCGAFLASYTDPLGRRRTILLACCIFVVGGTIQTAGVIIAMLYVGRLIAGIGVGFLTMIIPIYQAELAHRKIRGKITSLQQLFNALGQIFATWIGYGCYMTWTHTGNSREWRIPLGCQLVPAIFLGGLIMFFPESPRWLCAHDRADEGLQVLAQLHAHGDTSDSRVRADPVTDSRRKVAKSIGYFDLFRGWPNLRRTILVMAIQASCQMTGVSAIQYFSPQIFAQIGIPTSRSLLFQAVNAIIAFAGTTSVVDPTDIWTHLSLRDLRHQCSYHQGLPNDIEQHKRSLGFRRHDMALQFCLFPYERTLELGHPSRAFGTAMRLKGVSWGAMTSFAFNTMIGQVTPIAISSIGWKFYLVFIVCNLTNAIFFWCFQPETKGLNLEDMDELLRDSPTFVPGSKWTPNSHVNELAREIAKGTKSRPSRHST